MRETLLSMLFFLLQALSPANKKAGLAQLLAGNGVELTVQQVAENGLDVHACLLEFLEMAAEDAQGQKRLSAPAVVKQLIKAAARWLLQVHHVLTWSGELKNVCVCVCVCVCVSGMCLSV
jgi:hypothetical protein